MREINLIQHINYLSEAINDLNQAKEFSHRDLIINRLILLKLLLQSELDEIQENE